LIPDTTESKEFAKVAAASSLLKIQGILPFEVLLGALPHGHNPPRLVDFGHHITNKLKA